MAEFFEFPINKRIDLNVSSYFERPYNKHDARDQQRALRVFRELIASSMDFALKDKSCYIDNNFLQRFLSARKFQPTDAMELLINYFIYKQNNKYLLQNLNIFDDHIRMALRDGNPAIIRQRDRKGRKIITFTAANWDVQKYTLEHIYRALLLSLDKLLESAKNQLLGFVFIVDWTNFSFKQSTNLSPKMLKIMVDGLQDCMPVKYKGIHFIGQPWYVDWVTTAIRPFLKEKISKRFVIHGSNLTTLHNYLSKDVLPPDLGGEGPSLNTLDWYHYLLESSQTTDANPNSTYRLIQSATYSKSPPSQINNDNQQANTTMNTKSINSS